MDRPAGRGISAYFARDIVPAAPPLVILISFASPVLFNRTICQSKNPPMFSAGLSLFTSPYHQ